MEHSDYRLHYRLDGEVFDFEEEMGSPHREAIRRLGQEIVRLVRPNGDVKVLDVGCGSGWLLAELAGSGLRSLYGTDLSRAQYLKGKKKGGPGRVFVEADAYDLPFRDESMDVVLMTEVLEHMDRPGQAMRDAARVLRPGGLLVATVPAEEKIRYTLCIHCNKKTPVNAHLHAFDLARVKALVEGAGLRPLDGSKVLNKALIVTRAILLLRFLPASVWRVADRAAGLFFNRWSNICYRAEKPLI